MIFIRREGRDGEGGTREGSARKQFDEEEEVEKNELAGGGLIVF